MIKKIFSLSYPYNLVSITADYALMASVFSNIVTVFILDFILTEIVPLSYLVIFTIANLIVFSIRLFYSKEFLKSKTQDTKAYVLLMIFIVLFNALSYQTMTIFGMIYGVNDIEMMILIFLTIAMVAGSINILGSVFILFFIYISFSLFTIIASLLYFDKYMYDTLAYLILLFYFTYLFIAYRYYRVFVKNTGLEETFKTLYDQSSDGIILIKNKRYIDCNERILEMFKYDTKEEFLNSKLTELAPKCQPDNTNSIKKLIRIMTGASNDVSQHFEWLHKDRNNQEFWCEVILTKITLDDEAILYGVWRNISARKDLELKQKEAEDEIIYLNSTLLDRVEVELEKNRKKDQQLLEQSRLAQMGEMISMIAHQWRQPLAAISATTMAMELKVILNNTDKEKMLENIKNISKYSQHLSETIDDFKNFFKMDKKMSETTYEKIINNVLNIIKISIGNKNIEIVTEFNSDKAFYTFENELKQVILNIMKNAEDALLDKNLENAQIIMKTDANILTIKDNAGGIPEDIIDKIFDPYFSTKLNKNGTGLGLYMSKIIIEEHCNGKLSVQNDEDGVVFKISLTPV